MLVLSNLILNPPKNIARQISSVRQGNPWASLTKKTSFLNKDTYNLRCL